MNPDADPASPLPDLQPAIATDPAAPEPAPPNNGHGAATNGPDPGLVERIDRASDAAVSQHLAEQPPKKRGQRGPDRYPGSRPPRARSVPLAPLGDLSDPSLLADHEPTPLAPFEMELPPGPPPFDEDTAKEMAGFLTEFLNDLAGVGMESWALKHLGDAAIAADVAVKARMTDKLKDRWEKSLVKLAEKYRIALDLAPEVIAGGCLLLWGSNLRKQAVAIKVLGEQLRQGLPMPPAAP